MFPDLLDSASLAFPILWFWAALSTSRSCRRSCKTLLVVRKAQDTRGHRMLAGSGRELARIDEKLL
jgi:hypothetical protein